MHNEEPVMSKVESTFAGISDRSDIVPALAHPPQFELTLEEIEDRIVRAYIRLVFRADNGDEARSVVVTRSGSTEVRLTEMPPDGATPGVPLYWLEAFSLPSRSSLDGCGLYEVDEAELALAVEFVRTALREPDEVAVTLS